MITLRHPGVFCFSPDSSEEVTETQALKAASDTLEFKLVHAGDGNSLLSASGIFSGGTEEN